MSAIFFVAWCLINSRDRTLHIPVHRSNVPPAFFYSRSSGNGSRYSIQLVTQQVLYFTTDITRHQLSEHPWVNTRISFLLCLIVGFCHSKPALLKSRCCAYCCRITTPRCKIIFHSYLFSTTQENDSDLDSVRGLSLLPC